MKSGLIIGGIGVFEQYVDERVTVTAAGYIIDQHVGYAGEYRVVNSYGFCYRGGHICNSYLPP